MSAPLAQLRERLTEQISAIREKIPVPKLFGGQLVGAGGTLTIGQGRLINQAVRRLDEITQKIAERKPGLIPAFTEMISKFEPGKRISMILSPKTSTGAPLRTPATTPTTPATPTTPTTTSSKPFKLRG